MRSTIRMTVLVTAIGLLLYYSYSPENKAADKCGCEAYIYIANNSLFECTIYIDGVGYGNLLVGKNKTYKVELLNDTPKRIKVKVEYYNPNYIEPKSYYFLTKGKLECGQTDTMYIAHTE